MNIVYQHMVCHMYYNIIIICLADAEMHTKAQQQPPVIELCWSVTIVVIEFVTTIATVKPT